MRFDFEKWEPIYEEHEMFKVNICNIIGAMVSVGCGIRTSVRWSVGFYTLNSDPFIRLPHAPRGVGLLDSGLNQANELIQKIFHQKLLTY